MAKLPTIYGFNKTSEAGNNLMAPSIFLGGCNLRCPYCMNSKLVVRCGNFPPLKTVDIETVREYVESSDVDIVMISGGEPFGRKGEDLRLLFETIQSWGCRIGVSTNGGYPEALRELIDYVSYIAMDIKTPYQTTYKSIDPVFGATSICNVEAACEILHEHREKSEKDAFNFELRTTLYPVMIGEKEIAKLGEKFVKEGDTWVLQQFRVTRNMLDPCATKIQPYEHEWVEERLLPIATRFTKDVVLKYV